MQPKLASLKVQELRLYEVNSISEMENIRDSWNHIVHQNPNATPFQLWEWNYGMVKYEGHRIRLHILVAENSGGEIIGCAPFWIRTGGFPGFNVLEFIGTGRSDYLDLIVLDSYKDIFIKKLVEWIDQHNEWRIIALKGLRQETVNMLSPLGKLDIRPYDVCPIIRLPDTVEAYNKQISRRLRKNIRHYTNRLTQEGNITFSVSSTPSQLQNDLFILFDLHQQKQVSGGERGRFYKKEQKEIMQEITMALAEAGLVRLYMLKLGGKTISTSYNIRFAKWEYSYTMGMDPDFSLLSPGTILENHMIGEAIKDGMNVYDFLRGDEKYKSKWTNDKCQLFQIVRARTKADMLLWSKWESLRYRIYRSSIIKKIYHATIGKFNSV